MTEIYNCVAWAVGESHRWWAPSRGRYWPPGVPREHTLEAFIAALASVGFQRCDNDTVEAGFERIAIFVGAMGKPTHVARQLESGRWTSKLGRYEDIEHQLDGLQGLAYGTVSTLMRRPARRDA